MVFTSIYHHEGFSLISITYWANDPRIFSETGKCIQFVYKENDYNKHIPKKVVKNNITYGTWYINIKQMELPHGVNFDNLENTLYCTENGEFQYQPIIE